MDRNCDMCGKKAVVDTKTIYGYWAYLCTDCNKLYGLKSWQTKLSGITEGGSKCGKNEER